MSSETMIESLLSSIETKSRAIAAETAAEAESLMKRIAALEKDVEESSKRLCERIDAELAGIALRVDEEEAATVTPDGHEREDGPVWA